LNWRVEKTAGESWKLATFLSVILEMAELAQATKGLTQIKEIQKIKCLIYFIVKCQKLQSSLLCSVKYPVATSSTL